MRWLEHVLLGLLNDPDHLKCFPSEVFRVLRVPLGLTNKTA